MAILPLSVIQQREALARSLLGAGLQPNVSMGGWGGAAQAIAGVAQAFAGTRLQDRATQDRATRSRQTRAALAAALSGAQTPYQAADAGADGAPHDPTSPAVTMDASGGSGAQTAATGQPVTQATPFRSLGGRPIDQRILDLAATLDESSDGEGTKFLTDYLTKPRNLHAVGRGGLYDETTGQLVVAGSGDKPPAKPASIQEYELAQKDPAYLKYRHALAEGTHITVTPPPDRVIQEVQDPNDPTKTIFVTREQALGGNYHGKGTGRGGITAAQAASNDTIDTSRDVVEGYGQDRASLVKRVQPNIMDPSGVAMPNPDYDPFLASHFRNAQRKKVGADDGYKDFIGKYYPDAAGSPVAAAPASAPGATPPAAAAPAPPAAAAAPVAASGPKPGSVEELTAPAIGHVTVDGQQYDVIGQGADGRKRVRLGGKLGWY